MVSTGIGRQSSQLRRWIAFLLTCVLYLSAAGFWIQLAMAWISGLAPWGTIEVKGPEVRWGVPYDPKDFQDAAARQARMPIGR